MNQPKSITAADLARRSDFELGNALIRPSIKTIVGPTGIVVVEPRVVQVLLVLHDAAPDVMSRQDLLAACWGGVFVGDDALNRAIAEIRRAIRETGADIGIETIPRVGYRLTVPDGTKRSSRSAVREAKGIGRRPLLIGGFATTGLLLAGIGGYQHYRDRIKFEQLMTLGKGFERRGDMVSLGKAEQAFREAIAIDGRDAGAWGWLARVLGKSEAAREAAMRSLAIDPRNPDARMTLLVQDWGLSNWAQWEAKVDAVLADFPDHDLALDTMVLFHQGVGRCVSSWDLNERAAKLRPLDPVPLNRRAIKHWIFGRTAEADRVADRCVELWPRQPYVWNTRLMIYAFTDRAEAGLAFLADAEVRPADLKPVSLVTWRAILDAVRTRSPADVAAAVSACSQAARLAPGLAANAIMAMSWLGKLDAAYRIAEGLFAGTGAIIQKSRGRGIKDTYSDTAWARSQFLFIPAMAPFRADSRFTGICESAGLAAYWRERGIGPDSFVRGTLRLA